MPFGRSSRLAARQHPHVTLPVYGPGVVWNVCLRTGVAPINRRLHIRHGGALIACNLRPGRKHFCFAPTG